MKAGDNGEYFYEYVMNNHKDVDLTFLISKKSPDFERLKNKGFNVVDTNTAKLLNILTKATYIFASKFQSPVNKYISIFRYKSVFLNHGVSNEMNNTGFYFGNTINKKFKYTCCVSKYEKSVLENKFKMDKSQLIVTGFARWDNLIRKNKCKEISDKKNILITFHWRNGELNESENKFSKSDYINNINILLNSSKIKELSEKCNITFMYHAMFKKYRDYFKVPEYIKFGDDSEFQDLLVNADAIVTDFSSNAYEMAVIGKPAFYYIPDLKYVKRNMTQYDIESFDKYSIGKYCKYMCELFDNLVLFVDGKYKIDKKSEDNIKKVFDFIDDNNCKRIFNFIKSLNKE